MRSLLPLGFGLPLIALAVAGRLAAATLELPAELPLGIDSRLVFELDGADLHFTGRAAGLPSLRARAAAEGGVASLEVVSEGGSLFVRRPALGVPPEGDGGNHYGPRLRIDVALGPGRAVRVAGADLAVRFREALPEGAGGNAFRLAIERSTADLSGARVSEIVAVESSVVLAGTAGALVLKPTGGTLQMQGHEGRLELAASGAEVAVIDHRGRLVAELEGGSLEVAGGEGIFEGTAAEARLTFDGWSGPVDLEAHDASVDAVGAEHRDRWQIEGRESQVVLERVWGTVAATLEGGSLRARDLSASVQANASGGARLELSEVVGGVTVELTGGAEAVVAGVTGAVEAKLTDSRLEAERIDSLTLRGAGAEVVAGAVGQLAPIAMSDSELDLDLRETVRRTSLDLRGAGWARVILSAPCVVQLAGSSDPTGSPVDVVGCELRPAGHKIPPRQDRLKYGQLPAMLTVTAGDGATVRVDGEP